MCLYAGADWLRIVGQSEGGKRSSVSQRVARDRRSVRGWQEISSNAVQSGIESVNNSRKITDVSTVHAFLLHLDKELGRFCLHICKHSALWYVYCWHIRCIRKGRIWEVHTPVTTLLCFCVFRPRDHYHTSYCLSGLSVAQHFTGGKLAHTSAVGSPNNLLVGNLFAHTFLILRGIVSSLFCFLPLSIQFIVWRVMELFVSLPPGTFL